MKLGPLEPYDKNNPEHNDPTKYVIEYEMTGRRPETIEISSSFEDDASRRDFTINAMGLDVDGNIIDYFDGTKDIKNKVVKTVGDPRVRFGEDYLRMMRAARFSSKLGFDIHPDTKEAAKEGAENIKDLSVERIKDEIFKAANQTGDKFAKYIVELDEMGILEIILPEVVKLKEFEHNPKWHPEGKTVWEHIIVALKKNKVINPIANLAILLHDIGKTKTFDMKDGNPTYYGHAEEGFEMVAEISDRLKLSNKEREAITFAVINHMRFHKLLDMKPSKIFELINNDNWDVLVAVSRADEYSTGRKGDFKDKIEYALKIKEKWGMKTLNNTIKIVDGNHVMKLTGLKTGPKVGQIIKKVTEWVLDHGVTDQKIIDEYIMRLANEI